ncbi:SDR family NAD(P)-dependent oxidoreductase [Novosphingobium sp. AAP93]|uniref:SDR family NAD(P)-dependent oxidoreductase n=1 Tax=Novosphingobium sp. AAP93 TaxID=1523427 RepID=UPI0006B91485|nr:SDR family oxidoreductase [Novosphingobium sp. AAP93]KPF86857.1 short-chain dehydrogenase [Novosphingobium sp. AAP93]
MNTAIVTGAAQGLGLVTARRLAAAGYRVVLTDVQDVTAQAAAIGPHAVAISGDISSEAFVEDMAGRIAADFGGAQVLVNNAGISMIQPAEDTTLDQWQRMMAINLQGPFLTCRAFGKQMLSAGKGAIVNVASVAGLGGVIHRSAYNTSKHGLVGLTRTLAGEWGGRGVRVNAVCPGWIKTEMDVKDMGSGAYTNADIENRVPQARFAMPGDVAEAITFLASDAAAFINGVALPVDGGWTGDISWDALRLKTRG